MTPGRPRSVRLEGTGDKLYMALKLLGLSWSTRVEAERLTSDGRWRQCRLPRSVNTVLEDIRCGMAAERLDRYVAFFRVPAELFLDATVGAYSPDFSCQILKSRHDSRAVSPFDCGRGVANLELLNRQNDEVNLNNLLGLLGGCYDLVVRTAPSDSWLLGATVIGEPADGALQTVGVLAVPDAPVDFHGRVFRWHNYLHVHYASTDNQLIGYMMTPDPLQSVLVRHRRPFFMKLNALSGNLVPSVQPDISIIYVLHRTEPSAAFEDLRQAAIERPLLEPGHPRYEAVMEMLARAETASSENGAAGS
ncbi:MAG: hypothetical protein B193_1617 [Solidesulfovibrio magneticus str. Maddingley MBC34]|uniref:Uncharacterized protein n=1 Tax=Solidesulfovibrio magneticus str. Maddingley MBC34 TaxID=1206767 RepID=K6HB06_9BACT|nr:MAG: hypothetical protein B193_1617 [Solidesulfovibrio magneticus str. Maddingley MBC34]